ncbi:ATP-binding protein [bacterium]|nr:ATP-binding protein [bacterium]
MNLIKRDILDDIRPFYSTPDVLVIHGARQVGKTSLMFLIQEELNIEGENTYYFDLEDMRMLDLLNEGTDALMSYLEENGLLAQPKLFLFIDEIQYLSNPSGFLKLMRDHQANSIKLIVSGSSSFEIKSKFKNSLTGRTINFELRPLSFSEYLSFHDINIRIDTPVTSIPLITRLKKAYIDYAIYGGYPRIALEKEVKVRERYLSQVVSTYIRKDIRDLANVRNIDKFNKLLQVLASQCGQLLNINELSNTTGITRPTIEKYLFILEQTYVIKLLRPFSNNIRSELFKTPKIFFHDTGIAHLLWLREFPNKLFGNMLENAFFSDLLKNRDVKEFFFWRTQDGKEIDFIIRRGEMLIPIEVKSAIPRSASTSMRYFKTRYNAEKSILVTLERNKMDIDNIKTIYPWENIIQK